MDRSDGVQRERQLLEPRDQVLDDAALLVGRLVDAYRAVRARLPGGRRRTGAVEGDTGAPVVGPASVTVSRTGATASRR